VGLWLTGAMEGKTAGVKRTFGSRHQTRRTSLGSGLHS